MSMISLAIFNCHIIMKTSDTIESSFYLNLSLLNVSYFFGKSKSYLQSLTLICYGLFISMNQHLSLILQYDDDDDYLSVHNDCLLTLSLIRNNNFTFSVSCSVDTQYTCMKMF